MVFFGDKNHNILNSEKSDYSNAVYKYEEAIFSIVGKEFSEYTLCYTGSVSSGVEGKWKVATSVSSENSNMLVWTNDIPVGNYLFEHITLSPLGLQVIGSYKGEEYLAYDLLVEAETVDEVISLEGGGGSQNNETHTFSSTWDTKAPLDVMEVKALLINGVRIPVK